MLRTLFRWLLAVFFVAAGVNHFRLPELYLRIMPPYLPQPLALVYLSGVAEILGGLGVLFPRTRWLAGWGLMALLVAVFPANIYMLTSGFPGIPAWVLWLRLPFQLVFLAWVYWTCLRGARSTTQSRPWADDSGR